MNSPKVPRRIGDRAGLLVMGTVSVPTWDLVFVATSLADIQVTLRALAASGFSAAARWAMNEHDLLRLLDDRLPDAIVADDAVEGLPIGRALELGATRCPGLPFIVVSERATEDGALHALRLGATRHVPKHQHLLVAANLLQAMEDARATRELREGEAAFRSIFERMPNGFAYCRMVYSEGKPRDYVYLMVNQAFETLTGLRGAEGKPASELIPGIFEKDPGLLGIYDRVARTGRAERFERYVESLDMWFSVTAHCPRPEHFVAVFEVINDRCSSLVGRDLLHLWA